MYGRRRFKIVILGASVRVTRTGRVLPVGRMTTALSLARSSLGLCNGCGTGISVGGVGSLDRRTSNGLVLIATVGPAPTNRNGSAMAINLNSTLAHVNGGTVVTVHRPSLKPAVNIGNKTTNNNCTRIRPVRSVGLRFANSVRTVATAGGALSTLVSGRVRRNGALGVSRHQVA